jgi:site-specific DNA-methyltransferase (adenine-specific)
MTDRIRITNEDNMALMARYPDKHFDLAIVDPPYGIGASRPTGTYAREAIGYTANNDKKWDNAIPDASFFNELKRVSKNQIIWGANYMTPHLEPSSGWICWYKTDELKGRDFSECEFAYSSHNVRARHFEERPFIRNGNRIHPTQKPVALYKWLLKNYATPDMKILDTHLGSGSIAIACHEFGCELTACELDPDYYRDAIKRITNHINQTNLFI